MDIRQIEDIVKRTCEDEQVEEVEKTEIITVTVVSPAAFVALIVTLLLLIVIEDEPVMTPLFGLIVIPEGKEPEEIEKVLEDPSYVGVTENNSPVLPTIQSES